jgi:hypothetical protein
VDDPSPDPRTPGSRAAEVGPVPATVGSLPATGPRPEDLLRCRRLRTLEELIDDVLGFDG